MRLLLTALATLGIAGSALAQPAGNMPNMPGMSTQDHAAMVMAEGQGVVKALDAKTGAVTIRHGPIAALNWPAMTMAFKAAPPSLLQGVKVGQSVKFKLMQMGGSTTLTAIEPQ